MNTHNEISKIDTPYKYTNYIIAQFNKVTPYCDIITGNCRKVNILRTHE